MSKICAKCGNVIPEGSDVCPACGDESYNDEAVRSALSELELDLDLSMEEAAGRESRQPEQPEQPQAPARPPKKKDPSGEKKKASGKKKKKKRRMKKRSAAAIGVLIGLIIALLLVMGVLGFFMYKLGFFQPMSDEELLQTATVTEVTPSPSPTPEPTASPEPEPEESPTPTPSPSPSPTPEPLHVEKFQLIGEDAINFFFRGETNQVDFEIEPAELKDEIEWSSDNETIAVVDDFGVIQARRGGTCTITGTVDGKSIKVQAVCSFSVANTVLDMNYEDVTMSYEGQTLELAIDYDLPEEYRLATIWESSDPEVATVDDVGVVTAVSDGTAIITASIAEYTASCIVRCVNVTGNRGYNNPTSEYVINYEDVTLTRKGEYFQLTLTSVLGNDVPAFTWSTDDLEVATVDSKGVVTAVSEGVANITCTVNGDRFRCIVRVDFS